MLFRAVDHGNAAAAGQLASYQRSQIRESNHRLFGLTIGEGSGAHHQRAIGDGLGQSH